MNRPEYESDMENIFNWLDENIEALTAYFAIAMFAGLGVLCFVALAAGAQ